MKTKERVYISGAITGTKFYRVRFALAELKLRLMGKEVVNPARICAGLPKTCTHAEYMSVCIPLLNTCNAIYMLKKWEKSIGANIELLDSTDKDFIIYFSTGAFKHWKYDKNVKESSKLQ